MDHPDKKTVKIAVVIPCYRVKQHIIKVIKAIPDLVDKIYAIDDACPDQSGSYIQQYTSDPRINVLFHTENKGVGGAVITGYRAALAEGMTIVVKVDGDGQMDPELIPDFIQPILAGEADYTKGNRFYNLEQIHQMPKIRLFGNAVLSLLNKMSSGYWDIFDPTNGYTAIHTDLLRKIPLHKISQRYFFESDMLFRLNTIRAKVVDVPMDAHYGDEKSNLKISKILGEFTRKNLKNTIKRVFYNYYLRDMSVASIELILALPLLFFGIFFGFYHWIGSMQTGDATPTGTVMLAVLPIVVGIQLLLSFLSYDIANVPKRCIHKRH